MKSPLNKFFPKSSNIVVFKKGSIVASKGAPLDHAYIISSGKIALISGTDLKDYQEDDGKYVELEAGEIFGDVLLLTNQSNPVTCIAIEDSELVMISKEQFYDRIDRSDSFIQLLIEVLTKRISYFIDIHKERHADDLARIAKGFPWYQKNIDDTEKLKFSRMKLKVESDIFEAIENNLFSCEYQVITSMQSGAIKGFESLIRWENIAGSRVPPEIFIEIAEETSLIIPVSYWSIERSLADFSRILLAPEFAHCKEVESMFMSLNISAQVFDHKDFLSKLTDLCKKYNIDHSKIKLELTERVFMQDQKSVDTIATLKERGFKISIDDFGTGFSCLSYLTEIDVDSIKIDMCFVRKVFENKKCLSVVKNILHLCQQLKVEAIAEGIETEEHHELLKSLGCEYGQGYLYSRPLSPNNLKDYIMQHSNLSKKAA